MEWISVKDKLPELEERVLVTNGNYVEIKYLYDSNAFERNQASLLDHFSNFAKRKLISSICVRSFVSFLKRFF